MRAPTTGLLSSSSHPRCWRQIKTDAGRNCPVSRGGAQPHISVFGGIPL